MRFDKRVTRLRETTGIQGKFLIGLGVIFFLFCLLSSAIIYLYQKNNVQEEAFRRTEMVMSTVTATRGYVREVLRPKMYEVLGQDAFIIEAMSTSYVSRIVMERFKKDVPNFIYRRTAINAKNVRFEANSLEKEMVRYFNEHPEAVNWQGIMTVDGRRNFMRFQPVIFNESCLHCHGSPRAAPQQILEKYGADRGFDKKVGEIGGVVSIAIPVETSLKRIKEIALSVFSTVFLAVFFLYAIITFFFNRLVIQNLRELLDIFRGKLDDKETDEIFQQSAGVDEIDDLNRIASVMARHLQENRDKLKDYADNLELKVADRTKALQASEDQLQIQIAERNKELLTLNSMAELITKSMDLATILPQVLQKTLEVIPASGAGIYLFQSSPPGLALQCQINAQDLHEHLICDAIPHEIIADTENSGESASICNGGCGQLNFFKDKEKSTTILNVPLCCRQQTLGIITLTGITLEDVDPQLKELLLSIGRQVGITIESLQNTGRLLQSKELLQSVFDGITDYVALLGADGTMRMVNKTLRNRFNLQDDTIFSKPIRTLADDKPLPFSLFTKVLDIDLKEPFYDLLSFPQGEIFEVHFYPVLTDSGELENIVCYAKDVTLQKQSEQRMQQAEKLVSIGQLAAGVAHEINNPLGIILCYADLLKDDLDDQQKRLDDLAIIEKHAKNCQRIVSDLLNFARTQQTTQKEASVNQAVQDVVSMTASQFAKKQIETKLELADNLPLSLLDLDKIKQVFLNLLINASQAIGQNGLITICTYFSTDTSQVFIVFKDSGNGIDPEILDNIFDPFFTTKSPGEGTGLGLSLSYGIVKEHGGEITVDSTIGQGSIFTVMLPVRTQQPPSPKRKK